MGTFSRLACLEAMLLLCVAVLGQAAPTESLPPIAGGVGPDGWTVFTKSSDTQVVYVSSSEGDDTGDGLSPERPLKTLAKGMSLLRDGYPDWLLLKRGDAWQEPLGRLRASGRSRAEPVLIASYGDGSKRPLILLGDYRAGLEISGPGMKNIALTGLHFYDEKGDPASPDFVKDRDKGNAGVRLLALGENLLVEDCRFEMLSGLVIMGRIWVPEGREAPPFGFRNVQLRRSAVTGAWSSHGHCQGCFFNEIDGLLLEENLLDHNGWNDATGDLATVFNHNVYITIRCDGVIARGNIVARGSTTGIYCRTNGVLEDNLLIDNAPALNLGRITQFRPGGVTGRIAGNVVFGAPSRTGRKDLVIQNHGIEVGNVNPQGVVVEGNLLIGGGAEGIALRISPCGVGVHNVVFRDNVVYDWPRALAWVGVPGERLDSQQLSGIAFQRNLFRVDASAAADVPLLRGRDMGDTTAFTLEGNVYDFRGAAGDCIELAESRMTLPEWLRQSGHQGDRIGEIRFADPHRTIAGYHGSLGKPPTLEAFLDEAAKQSKTSWRDEYTAKAVIQYIRGGFQPGSPGS